MRLNSSTYPLLHALETGTYDPSVNFLEELHTKMCMGARGEQEGYKSVEDNVYFMSVCFGTTRDLFKAGQAKYICKTFDKAIRNAAEKIVDASEEYRECNLPRSIYLNKNGGTTIFSANEIKTLKAIFVGFDRQKIVAFATLNSDDYGIAGWGDMNWLKQFVCDDVNLGSNSIDAVQPESPEELAMNREGKFVASNEMHLLLSHWITYHLVTNYFVQFCEIETKEVKPGEKVKWNSDKHMNESKRKFTVLDCSWFTTLIHTHGHRVDGFFRWQPYGKNWSLRKLIWVDSFERKGSTRKAKVLNQTF